MASVPISAYRRLERKAAGARQRIANLEAALQAARDELGAIEEARQSLLQANGRKPNLRKIIGDVQPTQKDFVLAAVRSRPSRGMTRGEIVDHMQRKSGISISPNAVTTYLHRLSRDGLVLFDGYVWRAIER